MITRRTRRFPLIYLPFRELELRKLWDSRIDKTSNGPEVKAMDTIIARTWNLVDRSLTSTKIFPFSDIVRSNVDTRTENFVTYNASHNGFGTIMMQKEKYGMKRITFTNHKRLHHILDQNELNMRPRRLLRLLGDSIVRFDITLEKQALRQML
ncbi:hypothetical protein Tco_1311686 [Tanacetum coccineum]